MFYFYEFSSCFAAKSLSLEGTAVVVVLLVRRIMFSSCKWYFDLLMMLKLFEEFNQGFVLCCKTVVNVCVILL